jgi:hypothetical protein
MWQRFAQLILLALIPWIAAAQDPAADRGWVRDRNRAALDGAWSPPGFRITIRHAADSQPEVRFADSDGPWRDLSCRGSGATVACVHPDRRRSEYRIDAEGGRLFVIADPVTGNVARGRLGDWSVQGVATELREPGESGGRAD